MSTLSIFPTYQFTNGETLTAANMNASLQAIQAWSSNIDSTNIGAAGINLSSLTGTTFPGTSSYAFPAGISTTTGAFSGNVTTSSLTASGNVSAVGGGVLAYPTTFSSPSGAAGDAVFQRGSSTGALFLGGSVSSAEIDYGVSTGGTLTINKPLAIAGALTGVTTLAIGGALTGATTGAFSGNVTTGNLTATGNVATVGGGILAYPSVFSSPAAAAGDGVFQQSNAKGQIWLGGAAQVGILDYGVNTAAQFTLSQGGGAVPVLRMGAGGAYVPPVYNASGAALASTTHVVQGITSIGANTNVTITLSGAAVFSSASSYAVVATVQSVIGNATNAVNSSGSSFVLYKLGTGTENVSWIATGS